MDKCPVCQHDAEEVDREPIVKPPTYSNVVYEIDCSTCGPYAITKRFRDSTGYEGLRRKLARFLYETRDDDRLRYLTTDPVRPQRMDVGRVLNYKEAGELYADDGSALEKYENTLRRIASATAGFAQGFETFTDRWLIPTMDDNEMQEILDALDAEGYISTTKRSDLQHARVFRLTVNGLRYAAELRHSAIASGNNVFIAACFAEELKPAIKTIREVVSDLGYTDKVVTDPSTKLIDLEIYERIRESRFIVADLTCNRQSVYYEVGFADGLGIPFILTCRHDHFKGRSDWKRVHFDVNHRPILRWETEQELAETLRQHIWQLFGRAEAKPSTT